MSTPRIIGIVLVRNEDLFVRRAVTNIIGFCDKILLCDNGSTDGTAAILRELSAAHPKISYHALRHPSESHDLLQRFVGTPTWVFGVDGDEIYDPVRLALFRLRLLAGEFSSIWRMKGNVLHCTSVTPDRTVACGFMSPPSRSMSKLYNFAAINAWNGETLERLHGGKISFKEGFHDLLKKNFHESLGWEETPLRCLHLCFLQRSSQEDPAFKGGHRMNIQEMHGGGRMGKIRRFVVSLTRRGLMSRWKQEYYRRGPVETVNATPFFQE
jgi:hypothetical protein